MGRLYPVLMVMGSASMDLVEAAVHVSRPSTSTMTMPDCHSELGAIVMTDANRKKNPLPLAPTLPIWNDVFDYGELDPGTNLLNQDLHFVRAHETRTREADLVEREDNGLAPSGDRPRTVLKVPRQGEFDNVHIAPKMMAPPLGVNASDRARALHSGYGLDAITMAPFCEHDCFHACHLRWGLEANAIQSLGWLNGLPNAAAGAPTVPENQEIKIRIISKTAFVYKAEVLGAPAGQWQFIYHHGAAYAISITSPLFVAARGKVDSLDPTPLPPGLSLATTDVWALYAKLRFVNRNAPLTVMNPPFSTVGGFPVLASLDVHERLRITPQNLLLARAL